MEPNMNYVKKFEDMDFSENSDAIYKSGYLDRNNTVFMDLLIKYEGKGKFPFEKDGYKLIPFKMNVNNVIRPGIKTYHNTYDKSKIRTIYFLKPEKVELLNKLAANIEEMISNYNTQLDLIIQRTAYTDGKPVQESKESRGDIRKKAYALLGELAAAYLGNVAYDNIEKIEAKLKAVEESGIDWEKDVVKSVREEYKRLTDPETLMGHKKLWKK